jgi:uncharacterized protein YjbI with pentapeptide repeats
MPIVLQTLEEVLAYLAERGSLAGAIVMDVDLRGQDFFGARLQGTQFQNVNLSATNLSQADLSGSNVHLVDLVRPSGTRRQSGRRCFFRVRDDRLRVRELWL